jgi:hypothetical protein
VTREAIELEQTARPQGVRAVAYVVALLVALLLAWLINDVRLQLRQTSATVNEKLPSILEKTERSATALAELSDDVRQLRDLAGATGPRDATLATYADSILDHLETSGLLVGTKAKLSDKLLDAQPAIEWTAAARKEALWLTFRAKSKQELLERLTKTKFGSEWYVQGQSADAKIQPLRQWIESHPDLRLPTTTTETR